MLYDYLNRPVKTQQLTREHAAPSLTGIRTIWNETVASNLTPQRLASLLMAAADGDHHAYLTLAEEMEERDLHYAAELGKRKLAVSRLPITVESASDSFHDKEMAEAIRGLIKGSSFRSLLKDLLDSIGKGFSVVEILWSTGSQWKPQQYKWRDQRFFQFDQATRSEIRLRDEQDSFNGIELAPYKFLTHLHHGKSGIPIRGGIARLAAWAYMCKGYTIKNWLAFAEVFGMPFRIGKYGSSATDAEKAILMMAVANLASDAAATMPDSMQIDLIEAGNKGGSADFFERLANYLDNQVSKGILGQTASSSGTPGKLGNEELQAEVRDDIRDDDAEFLEETINRDLVRPFIDLNFGPQKQYPEFQLRAIPPEDVKALVEAVEKLVPLGLKVEGSVMRDKLGLPDPDPKADPEDLLRPSAAPKVEAQPAKEQPGQMETAHNAQQPGMDEQVPIDAMAASITDAALQAQADTILGGLLKQITEGADYAEVMAWLAEAEPGMDSTAMESMLGRALFIAETWGRINGGRD